MSKDKVSEWSSTAANNSDVGGINIAEGMAPSGVNNAMREIMAQIKDMQAGTDGDYFVVGGAFTATGAATFSSTMYVANVATFNNNVTIGASTTNSLTLNAATIVAPSALTVSSTGAIKLPSGTDAQRPTAAAGQIRYNTTAGRFEGYTTAWGGIGGGATGGGTDEVFQENGNTVNTSYTITTNKNAISAGDITIASSATVTVPTGSRWIIV
jgi:hypothetical protein